MDPELKKALEALNMSLSDAAEAQNKALNELREATEEDNARRDAAHDEKIAKLQEELNKFEPLNEAIAAADKRAEEAEARAQEQQETLDRIEARLSRPTAGDRDAEVEARREALEVFARRGRGELAGDRQNVLQVSDDNAAGVLAPTEYVHEILKEIEEYSPMRGLVTVRTTGNRSISVPKRTGLPSAVWVGETETRPDTEGLSFGMLEIPVHESTMAVPVSNQMLEDADFDILTEILEGVSHGYGKQEGEAIISGNANGKPQGFLNSSSLLNRNSGVADNISADSLIGLKYAIKTAYAMRGSYILNRATLEKVRTMKDGNGTYIWASGLAAGRANSIDGAPYAEMPDMPNVGAGLKPVAFGDWKRGYILVDRMAMSILRDDYTRAGNGQVLFRFRRRLGGAVSIGEAIATLTCAA